MTIFFYFFFCTQTCVIKSCRSINKHSERFFWPGYEIRYTRLMNIFSFFATHPRLQCLSLGEKGCLANTFDILLWSRLSLCFHQNWNNLFHVKRTRATLSNFVFYSCAKIPESGHKCIGLQSHESLPSTFVLWILIPTCLPVEVQLCHTFWCKAKLVKGNSI